MDAAFISWGNREGHMPTSPTSFDYNFGTTNSGPYSDTPGSSIVYPESWPRSLDPAQYYCGLHWYVPSKDDWDELLANCDFIDTSDNIIPSSVPDKRITIDGVRCIRLRSRINGAKIELAACGGATGTSRNINGNGYYWSSELLSDDNAITMSFNYQSVRADRDFPRCSGYVIRPVWRE